MNGAFVLCFTLLAGIVCVTICRVDKQEFETRMDGVHSRHDGNFQRRLKTPHCRRRSVCVDCNEEENKMCKTGECAETCPNRTGDSVNKCCNGNSCGDKEYCDIDDAVWGVIFAIVGAAACICICVCIGWNIETEHDSDGTLMAVSLGQCNVYTKKQAAPPPPDTEVTGLSPETSGFDIDAPQLE